MSSSYDQGMYPQQQPDPQAIAGVQHYAAPAPSYAVQPMAGGVADYSQQQYVQPQQQNFAPPFQHSQGVEMTVVRPSGQPGDVAQPAQLPSSPSAAAGTYALNSKSIQVAIRSMSYVVDLPEREKGIPVEKKIILNDLSLAFTPGRLSVLMGASGAGKTTLMQCIAGDVTVGTVYGSLELNGNPVHHKVLQKASAFVYQDDCILQTASVLESITMSAELRLPRTTSPEERQRRVNDTIRILNLTECKDTLIGSHLIRGVSGGERKRCAVGMELVTDPPIMFIDEGTSGLDTKNALQLVRTLRNLARAGHTVITTMHQPSSEIFHLFDDLIMLAKGELIFAGPAEVAVDYFASLGFQCPRYTNPADYFFTSVINSEDDSVSLAERSTFLIDAWRSRGDAFLMERGIAPLKPAPVSTGAASANNGGVSGADVPLSESSIAAQFDRPGFSRQFALLFRRALRNQLRNRLLLRGRIMQAIIMSVIVGLVYLRIASDQKGIQDRQGLLFFIVANFTMSSAMGVLSTFHGERPVFIRENGSGMYSLAAYFTAKASTELPILVTLPLVSTSILYWMAGLQGTAAHYFVFYCVAALMTLVGNGIGFFIASIFTDPNHALQILPLFLMPLMLFSGFMINDDSIPKYFIWCKYLSPMKYGLVALVKNEFIGLDISCETGSTCSITTGQQVVDAMGFSDEQTVLQNIMILMCMFFALMFAALMALWKIGSKVGAAKHVSGAMPQEARDKVAASQAAAAAARAAKAAKKGGDVKGALKV